MLGGWLVCSALLGFNVVKRKISADPAGSYIQYNMEHPLHSWDAKSASPKCIMVYDDESSKIEAVAVVAAVKSFDSGNSNRDSHAIEVLEALKYPNVTFSSTGVTDEGDKLSVKGNLNFHGVSRPLTFSAQKKTDKSTVTVSGDFTINMKDHDVDPPSLMSVKTRENIKLSFRMVFKL